MTLWPWPLTFWPWECFVYSASHVWLTYRFLLSYDYRLLSYEYCISDHISVIWNSHCACAVSRDLCIRGPPKPHVTIFWPRIVYSLYNFYGATMTIKGSFILERPHVKAVFGRKKKVQSKSGLEMTVFRKFKGQNIKYSHRDPQKALPYPVRRHLTYFA